MDLGTLEALVRIAWLLGAVAFVIGLIRMNSPATARNGNLLSAGGMALAVVATGVLLLANDLATGTVNGIGWLVIAVTATDVISQLLSLIAVAFATMNVVGGYVVTDRMLQMFRKKPTAPKPATDEAEAGS